MWPEAGLPRIAAVAAMQRGRAVKENDGFHQPASYGRPKGSTGPDMRPSRPATARSRLRRLGSCAGDGTHPGAIKPPRRAHLFPIRVRHPISLDDLEIVFIQRGPKRVKVRRFKHSLRVDRKPDSACQRIDTHQPPRDKDVLPRQERQRPRVESKP